MLPTLPLEAVSERDIDLLLCEEWSVNADYRRRFLRRVSGGLEEMEFERLAHSVTDPIHGESDIVMLRQHGDHRHALLIENKIDAIAQPEQAARYAKRAAEGQASGH